MRRFQLVKFQLVKFQLAKPQVVDLIEARPLVGQVLLLISLILVGVQPLQAEAVPANPDLAQIESEAEYQLPAALQALQRWVAIPSSFRVRRHHSCRVERILVNILLAH